MNTKTFLTVCLTALFSLSGCASFQKAPANDNTLQTDASIQVCPNGVCETDPFINYTQTRADYRQYGELSERDVIVSEAGAGNNLSAAIPPSLENEMIEYEEQVENEAQAAVAATTDSTVLPEGDASGQQASSEENLATQVKSANEEKASTEADENNSVVAQNNQQTAENDSTIKASDENYTGQEAIENAETENVTSDEAVLANQNENEEPEDQEEDPVRDWYAEEGQNLKALLTEWSAQSGWRLVWNSN